ncbi:hypothetical protein [Paenibacillus hamazuiensis]|uniref:hypothetical protein n=1 Tax=Paenibacillus hamazuiensis TaxID=2936508 RepID=UPI00200C810B|nr:hypothetical protein [Paenibacillus hamazuiensis]
MTPEERLKEMDPLFAGFYTWLAGQYDPLSGGFHYARSSFDMGMIPDIESTAQAVNILERSGLLGQLPKEMKDRMIAFFQIKQDPSGYFYDDNPNMRKDEVMVARALGYCAHSLHKLGGEPLYPLPHQSKELPEFMRSPEAYVAWLKQVDLRNSWRGCDLMTSANHYLTRLDESARASYVEAAADYFASIQHPDTGFWGGGHPYVQISGTFKLSAFYKRFGVPVPNVDKIYRALLNCLRHEEALDMCWVRNPIDLLETFRGVLSIPAEELEEIFRITAANMRKFLRGDGGFSRELLHSPKAPNVAQVKEGEFYPYMPVAVPIGQGLVEGDMNAGTQALLIREYAHLLAKADHKPLSQYTGHFMERIERIYA